MQSDKRWSLYQYKLSDKPAGKNSTITRLYTNLNALAIKQSNMTSRVQIVDQPMYEGPQIFHEYIQP